MWEKVSSRAHKPVKIFPFGSGTDEAMLYGTVDYGLKDGRKNSVDWAARAHLVKENDAVKMDFYQVYLVSAVSCVAGLVQKQEHVLFAIINKMSDVLFLLIVCLIVY